MCRTVLRKKSLLLLDEPFSALDEKLKDELLKEIQDIAIRENLCVLMVTHNYDDAKKVASKVLIIDDGNFLVVLLVVLIAYLFYTQKAIRVKVGILKYQVLALLQLFVFQNHQ